MVCCEIKEILLAVRVCRAHVYIMVLCPSKLQFCYKKKITFTIQNYGLLARITLSTCYQFPKNFIPQR